MEYATTGSQGEKRNRCGVRRERQEERRKARRHKRDARAFFGGV